MTTKLLIEDPKLAARLTPALNEQHILVTSDTDGGNWDAWLYEHNHQFQLEHGDWGKTIPPGTPEWTAEQIKRFIDGDT